MARRENGFKVEGVIVEALPNTTYRVQLANGHRLLGFATGKHKRQGLRFEPGQKVEVQLSEYDLSQGRILTEPRA
ncbi:MAG: translation initiation factor IF-1 [Verrucomicrobia bacterium]|nr:MAG: translation initiation factor IF-1 [Verrucomicrobiota bacterium]